MLKRISRLAIFVLLSVSLAAAGTPFTEKKATKVEIKDGWYYINGERFFIKAIGYEIGARPGQDPYKETIRDLGRMRADLKILKDGGFNTIRTWSQLSEEQLQLVQESGLKIIFGIWLKPDGNYGDNAYLSSSEELVRKVVAYTKKYDCVISYLILNEPMTGHVYSVGAKQMAGMLSKMKGILSTEHPGIPVGISGNAATDDFIDMNLLDFYGYNCYDYGNGQAGTMGFGGFLDWCNELNKKQKPMIITEFGYSVSDLGWGRYGGNTLEAQKEGVIGNYRGLLDAGAVGACPFYFADGWWKGGHPAVHDNTPEEWFGYWGYSDLKDSVGSPRPVWSALVDYMKALVVSPKNQQLYGTLIPLDLYLDKEVKKVVVKLHDSTLYAHEVSREGFLAGSIQYTPKGMEDAELVFEFFDAQGQILKTENIYVLLSRSPVTMPRLTVEVNPAGDLNSTARCNMQISITDLGSFQFVSDLQYNVNYHIGWESGVEGVIGMKELKDKPSFEVNSDIPANSQVMVASAGVTVKYGKFSMRIHDGKMVYRGKWFEGIGR
jgi:exo-beta-1,3-glucanase (GH17 family)